MKPPYLLPDYRCGECRSALYVREMNPPVEGPPLATVACMSRHCAQRDVSLTVALPLAQVVESETPREDGPAA